MSRAENKSLRVRPTLPVAPDEMRQWSDLLLAEIINWPEVSTRPMFGMTAVYHGPSIFGVLPRTRAMESRYSVSFKLSRDNSQFERDLAAEPRMLSCDLGQHWLSFELGSGDDIPDALRWFERAYQEAKALRPAPRRKATPHRGKSSK